MVILETANVFIMSNSTTTKSKHLEGMAVDMFNHFLVNPMERHLGIDVIDGRSLMKPGKVMFDGNLVDRSLIEELKNYKNKNAFTFHYPEPKIEFLTMNTERKLANLILLATLANFGFQPIDDIILTKDMEVQKGRFVFNSEVNELPEVNKPALQRVQYKLDIDFTVGQNNPYFSNNSQRIQLLKREVFKSSVSAEITSETESKEVIDLMNKVHDAAKNNSYEFVAEFVRTESSMNFLLQTLGNIATGEIV